jgi:hypothetical protein
MNDKDQYVSDESNPPYSNVHVKFEEYLKQSLAKGWEDSYLSFVALKARIDEIIKGVEQQENAASIQAETTALLVGDKAVTAEANFQKFLKDEIEKVNRFYLQQLDEISTYIRKLELRTNEIKSRLAKSNTLLQHNLQRGAKVFRKISKTMQRLVQLEKYAILNYRGFLKIIQQHDKKTPFKVRAYFETILNSQAFSSLKDIESRMRELETLKQSLNKALEDKRAANAETPRKAGAKLEFKAPNEQRILIADDDSDSSIGMSSNDERDEKDVETDKNAAYHSVQQQKSLQRRIWWFLIGVFVNQIANNFLYIVSHPSRIRIALSLMTNCLVLISSTFSYEDS